VSRLHAILPVSFASDAAFREWGKAISDALAACGAVRTAEPGQIDWATAVKPAGTSGSAGYEFYRFDDPLQATRPVFIKLEYGTGSGSATVPGMWVTVGDTPNGSGGFSGASVSNRIAVNTSTGLLSVIPADAFISVKPDEIMMMLEYDPAQPNRGKFILIERAKEADGTNNPDVAVVTKKSYASSDAVSQQFVRFGGAAPGPLRSQAQTIGLGAPEHQPGRGSDLALAPVFVAFGKWLYSSVLCYRDIDMAPLVEFEMTHLGELHTYLPLDRPAGYTSWATTGAGQCPAVVWED
jgi:hypothetical protein